MKRNFRVVIIDDEMMVVRGLSTIVPWHEIGCDIVGTAEDGEEGLNLIKALQPDIVISDIHMPKLSGLQMIRAMNMEKKDIKFIIMTGYRQFEYAKEAIDLGVMKFLLKPTKIEEIKAAMVEVTSFIDDTLTKEEDLNYLRKKVAIYEALSDEATADSDDEFHKIKYLIKQAIIYIKEHYKEKIELHSVAEHLHISTWYLCKLFKQEIGSNFVSIVNEVRTDEAKKLLTETNLKVYEICEEVGYNDNPYFTKTFKKYTGTTPNKYRNEHYQ